MNSLPHISHHLFAAALGTKAPRPRRPAPEPYARSVKGIATAVPLELLSVADAPLRMIRPLRAAELAAGI